MIRNDVEGLVLECDSCSNYIKDDTVHTYKEMSDLGKASGWICRKIGEQWYNFCCDECFIRKKEELGMDIVSEKFEPVSEQNLEMKKDWKQFEFEEELEHIENETLKNAARTLIDRLPDYFFEIAASSTGKYHPTYTNGKGGLVRHTKAAVRIAITMLRLEMYASLAQAKDYIIIALILHDGWKHGYLKEDGSYNPYTRSEHPAICAEWIKQQTDLLPQSCLDYIANLVLTHMGQWNMSYNSGACFAPKPFTQDQCFVHLCDYLASRKCLEFDFTADFAS